MNALGDLTRTKTLLAEQLGTADNHITTAYIDTIIPAHPFNEDLQITCGFGHTTDTDIDMTLGDLTIDVGSIAVTAGNLETGGHVEAGTHIEATTHLTAGTDITSTAGDIKTLAGDIDSSGSITAGTEVVAGTGIRNLTGDIVSEVGRISVGTVGNPTGATGNIINYGTGSIICEQGHIRASTYITADTGDIESTAGDLKAPAGGVDAPLGNSLFNRMQYTTYYGGSTFAAPLALVNVAPYNNYTIPNGTYNFVLFCTGVVGSATFPLELFTSYTDLLKDYSVKVDFQTCDNAGNASLGFNNIVIGHAQSAPADTSKCTILTNSTLVYAAPTIVKITVNLEYSPSP